MNKKRNEKAAVGAPASGIGENAFNIKIPSWLLPKNEKKFLLP